MMDSIYTLDIVPPFILEYVETAGSSVALILREKKGQRSWHVVTIYLLGMGDNSKLQYTSWWIGKHQ